VSDQIQPWPVVKQGNRSHPVPALQHLLRAHGGTVRPDGVFGCETDAEVRAFQQAAGLVVDGIVGPRTWSAIIEQVAPGSTGEAVRGVQEEFRFRNLSGDPDKGLPVDGVFGPQTTSAVRGFQQALGLPVDGVVGPVIWRALVSGMFSL